MYVRFRHFARMKICILHSNAHTDAVCAIYAANDIIESRTFAFYYYLLLLFFAPHFSFILSNLRMYTNEKWNAFTKTLSAAPVLHL